MSANTLVINCNLRETRVALIEDGVIAELQIERAAHRGTVGNIVLGRVSRVLPGMQAAFIEVGMERAAFLHVEDLIRPDDFEAYLSGDFGEIDKSDSGKDAGRGKRDTEEGDHDVEEERNNSSSTALADDERPRRRRRRTRGRGQSEEKEEDSLRESRDDEVEEDFEDPSQSKASRDYDEDLDDEFDDDSATDAADDFDDDDFDDDDFDYDRADDFDDDSATDAADDFDDDDSATDAADDFDDDDSATDAAEDNSSATSDDPEDDLNDDLEGEEDKESAAAEGLIKRPKTRVQRRKKPSANDSATADTSSPQDDDVLEEEEEESRNSRNSNQRRRRRRRSSSESSTRAASPGRSNGGRNRRSGGRSRRGGSARSGGRSGRGPSRVSRDIPITDVVKEGDQVIVQISKEPIGTKGARVTSHVSLPGRYCVLLPTVDHIGISKRIGNASERARLREVIDALKPKNGGVIVRTVAQGLTKKSLKTDLGYLMRLWNDVSKKVETAKAPEILYAELDLVLKTARDLFTDEIDKIVIDDKDNYARLVRFIEMFLPERVKDIELYQGDEPIFDAYGIEDEITRALSRKVPLPSGGYLIMDQAEALSAIDVNTGRFVGKGSGSLEETALKTNLEAVEEIAYQLRFRNVGGLVVLDLIDMEDRRNREKVYRALDQFLKKDKAKTTINRISELGLIEMTRKRTRESLSRTMHEPCFYCDGTGQIMSRTTIAYEILRQLRRERNQLPGYTVKINAHPAVIDLLQSEEKEALKDAEARYMRRIKLNPRKEYHIEQFDLKGE
ncbi:MAG: Rne/Rng family ribonuclease [Polyangiaceae bacterium]|nr:Rne/Rng family ribonuclease [Polyangiaceae bacterium]